MPAYFFCSSHAVITHFGSPAVVGCTPLDRWFCAPAFQRICSYRGHNMHNVGFYYKKMPPEQRYTSLWDPPNRQLRHISMSEKSLEKLLNPNNDGGLGDLIRHAQDMGDLVQLLQKALPTDQAQAVAAANIRDDGELVILASSSAWASRLRYETETLMEAARKTDVVVKTCSVRVVRE
jgi:hypothetical protein